jgi:hypothetical protein
MVVGESENSLFSPFDFLMLNTDTAGNELWLTKQGGAHADAAFSIVEAGNGDFLYTGYSGSYSQGNNNLVLVRTDSASNIQWVKSFGGPGVDIGYKIIKSVLGGYIMIGIYTDSVAGTINHYLIHTNENGDFVTADEPEKLRFTVYPNPAHDFINFISDKTEFQIEITDVFGRKMLSVNADNTENINISQWPAGMYVAVLTDINYYGQIKFMKH